MPMDGTVWMRDDSGDRFDRVIEWLLIALLAFMPLAFGVVEAWSEEVVILVTGALVICFFLKAVVARNIQVTWTWAYIPLGFFILVVLVQLLPMPPAVVGLVSPGTMARKSELLGDLANADEVLSRVAVSFYPYATRHDLRLVLSMAAVFVVVLNVYRRPAQIMRLLVAISVVGGGVIILALAQNVIGNDKIYWFVNSPHGVAHSGPFVNHSHYAQFMNLSIGAALAVLLVMIHRRFLGCRRTPEVVAEYLGSAEARFAWVLLAVMVLGASTVFLAMTRGGVISMLIAGAFTTLILSSRRPLKGSGWIMALLALGAFVCVLYVGFDAVYDRLTTLRDLSEAQGGRWQIVENISVAWAKFPVLGTGLGTHEVVYPEFDRSVIPALASHAENEYAQIAEETGIAGLLAIIAFAALAWVHYVRALRHESTAICAAVYGLGFGLAAVMVHSLSDFGQHLPANAVLTVVFCALLIRLARAGAGDERESEAVVSMSVRSRRCWIAGLVVVCLLWAWALPDADGARQAESHWRHVLAAERDLAEKDWQGSDAEYAYLLDRAARAAESDLGNVKYEHWLNVYRWRAISRISDPNTGEVTLPPEAVEFAERIAERFNQARVLCPTFGSTWCVLGQLERSVLGLDEQGSRHIREGVKLAPCDAVTRIVAGTLEAEAGAVEAALDHWKRAVQLDRDAFSEVASLCVHLLRRPDLALELSDQNDAMQLDWLAKAVAAEPEYAELADQLNDRIQHLLEQECQDSQAPAWKFAWLAVRYREDGATDNAIKMYRRALAAEYNQIWWRLRLAELYEAKGLASAAAQEARICLRLRPDFTAAQRLLERLLVPLDGSAGGS